MDGCARGEADPPLTERRQVRKRCEMNVNAVPDSLKSQSIAKLPKTIIQHLPMPRMDRKRRVEVLIIRLANRRRSLVFHFQQDQLMESRSNVAG
jgi:hypothetical protein